MFISKSNYNALLEAKKNFEQIAESAIKLNSRVINLNNKLIAELGKNDPLAHPELYLSNAMKIVDDMTMAQRIELLKYLEESIEKNKRPRASNACEAMCMED